MSITPPEQFSEADAEQIVLAGVKRRTNADVALSEKVSNQFENARQMRKLLETIQDLIRSEHHIVVELATGSDTDNEKLRVKTYENLARWTRRKVQSSGQPAIQS